MAISSMSVKSFRYRFQGIKAFLAPAALCGVFFVWSAVFLISPITAESTSGIGVSRELKWSAVAPHSAGLCVYLPLLVFAHTGVLPA